MARSDRGAAIQAGFAERFAQDFEAELLAEKIRYGLQADFELAQICDAVATADRAADVRAEHSTEPVKRAWGKLRYEARQRALEVVAVNCRHVVDEADDWSAADDDAVNAARAEAREWLRHHSNEAVRADVDIPAETEP